MKNILILIIFGLKLAYLCGQEDTIATNHIEDTITVDRDIFAVSGPMELTLKFNIKEYQKNKFKGEYIPVELFYHFNDTVELIKKIRVKARGAFRRQHCSMPPFWLNIRKAQINNKALETTRKIKMVTHCKGSKAYSDYVLTEFLAYKIYGLLSPYSFRVRLVKINYIDTGRKNKEISNWAFMIEPEEMLAERMNGFPMKSDKTGQKQTDPQTTDVLAVFQYLIGNSDYSIAGRHNIKLIKVFDFQKPYPYPVPYDFDYSGMVNAYYAIPGENLGIESVSERYFLGVCRTNKEYLEVLSFFKEKKEDIYSLVKGFPYLSETKKSEILIYFDEFFTEIDKGWFIKDNLISTCR